MTKIGVYPGSFNPWHKGHTDILQKALEIFDHVIVAQGVNVSKTSKEFKLPDELLEAHLGEIAPDKNVTVSSFDGLLVDFIERLEADMNRKVHGLIRGLRNSSDLQYEMNFQYINEDLGLDIPICYFITDRELSHISSSTLRELRALGVSE